MPPIAGLDLDGVFELLAHRLGLTAMPTDGFFLGEREAVVHRPVAGAQRPERRRPHLAGRISELGRRQHWNTVAGAADLKRRGSVRWSAGWSRPVAVTWPNLAFR
jgi:hypothetical protein